MARSPLVTLTLGAVGALALVGCVNERTYVDPDSAAMSFGEAGAGIASLRGDVGELPDIDNSAEDMWVSREPRVIGMSGNVPHQARMGSSVYLDIRIVNADQMRVGEEIRQSGVVDTWDAENIEGPALGVYVCPNGEGISGDADDIVVTKTGPDTFTFEARSTDTAQNLDVDLDLAVNASR